MTIEVDMFLDPVTGDFPDISRLTTGIELIEQRIRLRLYRGTGEWFLDPAGTGLPLIAWRQMKPPVVSEIVARIQAEIRDIPGVARTENWQGTHDPAARSLTVSGDVVAADGAVTSTVVIAPTDVARNSFVFQIFFTRGSGPVLRPAFRGPG